MSPRAVLSGIVLCALLVLAGEGRRLAGQALPPVQYSPIDIQYGSRIYAQQCVICHGATGDLIAGVDLGSGRIRRAPTDNALRGLIATGIPDTAMPAFKFDASQLTMIVAYVRNMRDFDAASVPLGDPARGQAIFEGSGGCAVCHRINGKGPRQAPDLSDVGSLRSAAALQKTLLDPSAAILPLNRSVRAVTRDGKVLAGRRLNEDTYTVQLIDEQERLVSLTKADLRDYSVVMSSAMASYKDKLNAQDIADVVSYLLTLKGLN